MVSVKAFTQEFLRRALQVSSEIFWWKDQIIGKLGNVFFNGYSEAELIEKNL